MPDGTLVFDTKIDKDGFEVGKSELERETNKLGGTFKDTLGGILASQALTKATDTLVEFAKTAITTASDLAEVQNVVDVTFGSSAESIDAFARSAMTNFGLTELQAKQYSSTMGAMLKSMGVSDDAVVSMSKDMTALVGDMASFYNLDHETAFQKIRSGLSGETEPLKQLGINLSVANLEAFALAEGLNKTYEEMSEAERANLRFSYIMQTTADAQGDFVRTSDGFANQLRIMQGNISNIAANVGSELLPALELGLAAINGLFTQPESNVLLDNIHKASNDLAGIEREIGTLKAEYATTTLNIRLNYTRAEGLLDDLRALEALPETEERANAMSNITAALTQMYPELKKYVGEDGVFKLEADQIGDLIGKMHELQKEQAMTTLVSGYAMTYQEAIINYQRLGDAYEEAAEKYRDASNKVKAVDAIGGLKMAMDLRPKDVSNADIADAINQYIAAFGGLDDIDPSKLATIGAGLENLFGADGIVNAQQLTEEQIEQMRALFALIDEATDGTTAYQEQQVSERALDEAERALSARASDLRLAAKSLQETEQIVSDTWGDGTTPIIDYQAEADAIIAENAAIVQSVEREIAAAIGAGSSLDVGVGEAIIDNIEDEKTEIGKAVEDAVLDEIDVKINPVVGASWWSRLMRMFGGGTADGSHSTGLDRVPYDNYIARLHVGEAVLNASEAERWRRSNGGIDYSAIAAAVASAMPESNGTPVVRLYVDGKEFASSQATNNRTALAVRSVSEARGYGKK